MSRLPRHSGRDEQGPRWTPATTPTWQPDALAITDEAHLVATSDNPAGRAAFAGSMSQFIQGIRHAEVCPLFGRHITDLDSLCYQLEHALPWEQALTLERRIDGPRGLTNLLRQRPTFRGRPAARHRYYLWHDADVLLERDADLFGRAIDAILGVAAEAEYVSDDLLLIHRLIAVGGSSLCLYACDQSGQFNSWYDDGCGEPFWSVVTGIEAPTTQGRHIEELMI